MNTSKIVLYIILVVLLVILLKKVFVSFRETLEDVDGSAIKDYEPAEEIPDADADADADEPVEGEEIPEDGKKSVSELAAENNADIAAKNTVELVGDTKPVEYSDATEAPLAAANEEPAAEPVVDEAPKEEKGIIGKVIDYLKPADTTENETRPEEPEIKPTYYDPTSNVVMDAPKLGNSGAPLTSPFGKSYVESIRNTDNYFIDLGENEDWRILESHPGCQAPQYPTPFALRTPNHLYEHRDEYAPSPYTSQFVYSNSGPACIKKDTLRKLENRFGNA